MRLLYCVAWWCAVLRCKVKPYCHTYSSTQFFSHGRNKLIVLPNVLPNVIQLFSNAYYRLYYTAYYRFKFFYQLTVYIQYISGNRFIALPSSVLFCIEAYCEAMYSKIKQSYYINIFFLSDFLSDKYKQIMSDNLSDNSRFIAKFSTPMLCFVKLCGAMYGRPTNY